MKNSPDKTVTEARVRVRYAETDQMGVVYYANYLVWMEVARMGWCRARGVDYSEMERHDGIFLAVAEANCRYRSPARFDDEVVIKVWLEEASSRMVIFHYEMSVGERVVATGHTRHVFVSSGIQKARCPERFRSVFGIAAGEPVEG
ncbi:MAG TPA: thioesterase family protein [Verrucomicrobiae bacterium]|nr:thioesterase family protein [Verrucomicrobiae bacterium]